MAVTTPDPVATTELELSIEGMTCAACAARITKKLNGLDGVSATVNYATDRAVVLAPVDLPVQTVLDEVERAGYRAEPIEPDLGEPDGGSAEDERVRRLGRRLLVAAVLFMPLCDASLVFSLLPVTRFPFWQWVVVVLAAPVVIWAAWPIHAAALRAARHGTSTMDTLVSLGILASTGWSLYVLFLLRHPGPAEHGLALVTHPSNGSLYLDVAAGVTTFLLAGRYYEAVAKRRTGDVLRALAATGAKDVSVITADGEARVPVGRLRMGDRFVVRSGERVAADGVVESGSADMDRSLLTGESVPVPVEPGDRVVGGTIALGGTLTVEASAVGTGTQLAQMVRLVEEAQNEKASVQRLADRIAAVFVPAVLVVAAVTFVAWLGTGGSTQRAFSAALAVLIIACPCSLGLATPTALFVASGRGAQLGIFIKGYPALERSRVVDVVVLDKTGTVTEGTMQVVEFFTSAGVERRDLLYRVGTVEQASEHVIGAAVAAFGRGECGPLGEVDAYRPLPGLGAEGTVDGRRVVLGSPRLFATRGEAVPADVAAVRADWERAGRTAILVAVDGAVVGAIALADTVQPTAARAVDRLHALGLRCILLTGDNHGAGAAVGSAIGVDEVVADAVPAEKVALVRHLQEAGRSVAFIGDGVNDGPALTAADLGLAVGSGTDVAIHAADMILLSDDLTVVPMAIGLARRTLRTIHGNLAWAFAYNLAAIPLAAAGLLNPLIAGASMALSSSFVVWNSSRLRTFGRPPRGDRAPGPVTSVADA